jgi:hypothetical protein
MELSNKNNIIKILKEKIYTYQIYNNELDELILEQENLKKNFNGTNNEDILLYQIILNNKFSELENKISNINQEILIIKEKYNL